MATAGSCFFTVSDRLPAGGWGAPEPGPVVVWLWGDHDLSTDETLSATLARAIAVDSVGLVLDLSEVESMAPSTLEVIVRARRVPPPALRVPDGAGTLCPGQEQHRGLRPG